MPVARERRVVRHLTIEPKFAEPPIGKVQMYFLAQPPLGADAHTIANDKHSYHQVWVNRRSTHGTVERLERGASSGEVEKAGYPAQNVITWDVVIKTEIVE